MKKIEPKEKMENLDRFKVRIWDGKKMLNGFGEFDMTAMLERGFKPMLCTGLRDSVGELIYEGDLLEANHELDTFEVIREKSGRFIMISKGKRACIVGDRVSIVGNVCTGGGAR